MKEKNRRLSCYKIMIALGLYDMASIWINSLLTGYLWIIGANYCSNPNLIYASGAVAIGKYLQTDISTEPRKERLFFCFFTPPLIFNSDKSSWYFYTFTPNHSQKEFFLQCTTICMISFACAMIYVYMQFFPTPSYFVHIGHITWQLENGFPAFVYLFLNRTIQREALTLLRLRKPVKPKALVLIISSSANNVTCQ
ncbi:hypothetical protein ANCCEY_10717 [Ancylostoma ceylanicum]|uniref:7TM GPCR serpentine receptor class x (Srx) domain-containing protein n=1 Tax=Ancylostoma ceylanicum TaxID=53326 RepID=A0A0D6LRB3_9BILA|nr:hypothetical protein ANCCEY_10717 [Ancylostoma ceylanicum]